MCSHSRVTFRKKSSMRFLELPPLKTCSGILPHNKDNYPVSGLHVDSVKEARAAQLKRSPAEEKLQKMMKRRSCYAIAWMLSDFSPFIDKSPGFLKKCDLDRTNVLCTEITGRSLWNQKRKV